MKHDIFVYMDIYIFKYTDVQMFTLSLLFII